jgi:hypothetical protein
VGIDGREGPLRLAKSQKLAPDLAINGMTTSVEDTLAAIDALRPAGWTQGRGVDGTSPSTFA